MAFKPCSNLLADLITAGAEKKWQMEYKGIVNTGDTFGGKAVGPAAWQSKDKEFVLLMFRDNSACEYELLQVDPESNVAMTDFMGNYGHSPDELLEATRVSFTTNAAYAAPPANSEPLDVNYTMAGYCDAEGGGGAFDAAVNSPAGQLITLGRSAADGLYRSILFFDSVQIPAEKILQARLEFLADGGESLVRDMTDVGIWTGTSSEYWSIDHWQIPDTDITLMGANPSQVLDDITHFKITITPNGNGGDGVWITINDTGGQAVGSLYSTDPISDQTTFYIECNPVSSGRTLNRIMVCLNDAMDNNGTLDEVKAVAMVEGKITDPLMANIGVVLNPAAPPNATLRAAILDAQRPVRTMWDLKSAWSAGELVQSPDLATMLNTVLTDNAYAQGQNLAFVIESMFPGKTVADIDRRCGAGSAITLKINPEA